MKKYARVVKPGLAFLALAILAFVPAVASGKAVEDSEEFSGFLAQAKTEALLLQQSAEEMNSFVHLTTSRETQAAKIEEIKTHLNKLAQFVTKMNSVEAASPWQRQASRDFTPMVGELAANVTMTIYYLGEFPDRLVFTSFPEYVAANAELAANIAEIMSEYVEYGQARQKAEVLSYELELPES